MNDFNPIDFVRAVRVHPHRQAGDHAAAALPTPSAIAALCQRQASLDPEWRDSRVERDPRGRLAVSHSLSLGAAPAIRLSWRADPSWYTRGYRVEIYVRADGFAALSNLTPIERVDHGRCVGEAREDDATMLALPEGRSYLTVLLVSQKPEGVMGRCVARQREKWTGSPVKVPAMVRFAADVPSLHLANDRIAQQSAFSQHVLDNIAARVRLASAGGTLDTKWYADRHEADVQRQSLELIATWRGIESAFAQERRALKADETLSPTEKLYALAMLNKLRLAKLRAHQLPATDDPESA